MTRRTASSLHQNPRRLFPKGFRIAKIRESRGGTAIVFLPDLIRTGLHFEMHPNESHIKTPNPLKTTQFRSGPAGIRELAIEMMGVVKIWNRPPSKGLKITGVVFPNPSAAPMDFHGETVSVDFDSMANNRWYFILEDSTTFVETFQALRREGRVKPGDYFFAWIKRIGEFCGGIIMDESWLPSPTSRPEWATDLAKLRSEILGRGIFFVTFGREERLRMRDAIHSNPALQDHLIREFDAAFNFGSGNSRRRGRGPTLREIRRENQLSARTRPRRAL